MFCSRITPDTDRSGAKLLINRLYLTVTFTPAYAYHIKPLFMKKYFSLLILFVSFAVTAFSQTVINDPLAEQRTVTSFHGIEVSRGIELLLTMDADEAVAVSASDIKFRENIVTEVVNGILKIYYKKELSYNTRKVNRGLKAYVSCKTLDLLDAQTGARVNIVGVLKADNLKLNAATGARVKGKVEAGKMSLNQGTGSEVVLEGTVSGLQAEGSTGSHFSGDELKATTCDATVSTGAKITVTVEKELVAKANTGGKIMYKGEGVSKDITVHTGGSVKKI